MKTANSPVQLLKSGRYGTALAVFAGLLLAEDWKTAEPAQEVSSKYAKKMLKNIVTKETAERDPMPTLDQFFRKETSIPEGILQLQISISSMND